ncbi:hypothetical protein [Rhodopila sp.]|uniref:hypothetical protein n=1 Tax=Rhodopila sp. TaxID=2480087 RepID=UPI003D11A8B4
MLKTRLLQAACTVAMLAAVPALAQTSAPASNAPADSTAAPSTEAPASPGRAMGGHPMHHSAMGHSHAMMHGRSDTSQNADVDRLNEQSYQAAQQGQTYGGVGGSGAMMAPSSGAMTPSGSGTMPNSTMPNSTMPNSTMPAGSAPGTKP